MYLEPYLNRSANLRKMSLIINLMSYTLILIETIVLFEYSNGAKRKSNNK